MAKIINLRQARKARERAEKKAQADANAVSFGTPKAEVKRLSAERERAERQLDGLRRERDGQEGGEGDPKA